ncbi:hypothetical protein [Photobacterium aquimaris]|uniref:Uncharacterized protein n=1 Tax=Photobacterium aquimaris TaxID=512643 RepID=A0A2T3HU12_9GAMM|nr:hypothetical protein [Photobacterium aquimaris]OBU19965.1 hypothetical protein AYY21_18330 [Photobacterium aquimaris]PQJ36875.1 hypothetical protein BTN98_18985 [Photobacterium aquimaris]PST99718.1 hypothetical protein C0W81_16880 [Photobacterium aquimaris]
MMNVNEILTFLNKVNATWDDKQECLSGTLTIDDQTISDLNIAYKNKLIDEMVTIEGDPLERKVSRIPSKIDGKIVSCKIFDLIGDINIYPSVDKVAIERPVHPPARMLIFNATECLIYDRENKELEYTGKLKHYINITSVWDSLSKCADDERDGQLTFLYRKKVDIFSKYPVEALDIEFDGLERLIRTLNDLDSDAHKDAKCHILQNALFRLLNHVESSKRFGYLLENFTKFSINFDDAYHAYVVGFSFDDLRKEYEEKHREYMVKINDLISSSLVRALMIPSALYLTATRTQAIFTSKDLSKGLEATIVNVGIGIASIIVCVVFAFLISNEKQSLTSIKLEFNSLMGRLEDKSPQAFGTIKEFRENVRNRLLLARTCFKTLSVFNYLAALISIIWVVVRFIPESYLFNVFM